MRRLKTQDISVGLATPLLTADDKSPRTIRELNVGVTDMLFSSLSKIWFPVLVDAALIRLKSLVKPQ